MQIGNLSHSIVEILDQSINMKMFEPFKAMRVVFQIREIKANFPLGVLSCDILADFQVKPCNPKISLRK